jgi:predicted phage tail protein
MMRDIYLYGAAGRLHGSHFRLDVASPAEAVRALMTLRPGLRRLIRDGAWRVIVGPPRLRNAVEPHDLGMAAGRQPIHIVPATPPRGGGSGKSIGQIILGTILIAVAVASGVGVGILVPLGVSMVLSGVSGLLFAPVDNVAATDRAGPEDRPSFLFNGVTNNSQQGGPVPLVFGTHLVGSVVINAGLNAEDLAVELPPSSLPPWWPGMKGGRI